MDTCQDQQGLGYAFANHRGGLGFGPNSGLMILFQSLESADVMKSIIWLFLCNWLVAGRGYVVAIQSTLMVPAPPNVVMSYGLATMVNVSAATEALSRIGGFATVPGTGVPLRVS
jgi:hypothetical protein